jgi:hypothetical protein
LFATARRRTLRRSSETTTQEALGRMSPSHYDFHEPVSLHGRLDPWSDDQTTTTYESRHFYNLWQTQEITRAGRQGSEPVVLDDFVLPDVVDDYEFEPGYPARGGIRRAAHPARRASPAPRDSRVAAVRPRPAVSPASGHGARLTVLPAQARTNASAATSTGQQPPPLRPVLPALEPGEDEEDNPFARTSVSASTWFRATAAAAGVFGAVLFGRVLLEASKPPSAQASRPLTAAALDATPEPASPTPSLPGPADPEPVVAASDTTTPQLRAAASKRSNERPARRASRRSSTREDTSDETARRVAASSKQPNTGNPAPVRVPAVAEPRESKTVDSAPAMLRINSRPWSQVFIDGKLIGNTPQLGIQLSAGKHSVRLVNSEFGMSKTIALKLGAGESVTRVEILSE